MIEEWMKKLLEKYGVDDISSISKEDLEKEADDIHGSISNELIWRDGSQDEGYEMHQYNIRNLFEFLGLIKDELFKEKDIEFESFLVERNDEICRLADEMIRECEGCENYQHDMFYTAMVIEKAEAIIPKCAVVCYPYYDEYHNLRLPCYRACNCERSEKCVFEAGMTISANSLIGMLAINSFGDVSIKILTDRLKEYVSTQVAPNVKEALDGKV